MTTNTGLRVKSLKEFSMPTLAHGRLRARYRCGALLVIFPETNNCISDNDAFNAG